MRSYEDKNNVNVVLDYKVYNLKYWKVILDKFKNPVSRGNDSQKVVDVTLD